MKPEATSTEPAPEKPPGKKDGLFARIRALPSRFSLPAKGAIAVACFLVVLIATVWVAYWLDPNNVPWRYSMTVGRLLTIFGLVVVLPIIVWELLRSWLEGNPSRFPDIDFAWRTGLAVLKKNGVPLDSIPVFLVVGSSEERTERALLEAGGLSLLIRGVPEGHTALHWYAHPGGIFLFLTDACRLSALGARAKQRQVTTPTGGVGHAFISEINPAAAGPSAMSDDEPMLLSTTESLEYARRLGYVCELLRRARQPSCPCNGILTLLPMTAIQSAGLVAGELGQTIKSDLLLMQRTLQVRCPVIALVTGMEGEPGFRELVRRVGAEDPSACFRRFGKGFDLEAQATTDELSLFAAHVASVFEDWIYQLFRAPGALTRPGNRHLYSLLCQIRSTSQLQLSSVLAKGFGHRTTSTASDASLMFAGCYFAATGDSGDQRAFVKGVMEKMVDEQDILEWTGQTLSKNRRYVRMTNGIWILNAIALFVFGVMFIRKVFP